MGAGAKCLKPGTGRCLRHRWHIRSQDSEMPWVNSVSQHKKRCPSTNINQLLLYPPWRHTMNQTPGLSYLLGFLAALGSLSGSQKCRQGPRRFEEKIRRISHPWSDGDLWYLESSHRSACYLHDPEISSLTHHLLCAFICYVFFIRV